MLKVDVPWARTGSNFTLLFEALVVDLARTGLTAAAVGRIVGEFDAPISRLLEHYVDKVRWRADFSDVATVGVDETWRQRNHVHVVVFADVAAANALFVTEGKDHVTLASFKDGLVAHGRFVEKATDFNLDMSQTFIRVVSVDFPNAHLIFDWCHVLQLMNDAIDEVRRNEQKSCPELRATRRDWLKNETSSKLDNWADFTFYETPSRPLRTPTPSRLCCMLVTRGTLRKRKRG